MTDRMQALTLWQPWASGVALGLKFNETRSWETAYRGRLAIHAAKTRKGLKTAPHILGSDLIKAGVSNPHHLPFGCVVATVRLADVVPVEQVWMDLQDDGLEVRWGDYSPGRFAWLFEDVRRLVKPIKARGHQGLWSWDAPEDLDTEIVVPLEAAHG